MFLLLSLKQYIKTIIILLIINSFFSNQIVASVNYDSAIVLDANTGLVLHAEKPDMENYPASLTKLMTLYITFNAINKKILRLDQELIISKKAEAQPPTKINLKAGEKISVEQAIEALIVKSANDAATVLSENLSGSEEDFAELMTKTAKQIGMKNTTFKNPSG
jgi:D-alanyl-D-alanine carboxypeptidase